MIGAVVVILLLLVLAAFVVSASLSLLLPILVAGALYIVFRALISIADDRVARTMFDGGIGVAIFILILWWVW